MNQDKNLLSEKEKDIVINSIKDGKTIPKEYLHKMAKDDEDVFLFWNGRSEEVTNAVLPFHSIEHIDEPRKEKIEKSVALDLFSVDERGRQLKGWTNKLIWGDNKLILSSLANGPLRKQIENEGGIKLIYIDPPFAVGADFGFDVKIGNDEVTKKQTVLEEIAYRDTWGRGISSYLSMMYERLKLMHDLLADDGSIYVHCDWRVVSYLKSILNDIFGETYFQSEIIWKRTTARSGSKFYNNVSDSILFFTKSNEVIWNQLYTEYDDEYINTMFRGNDEKGQYRESPLTAPGKAKGLSGMTWKGIDPGKIGKGRHWAIPGYVLKEITTVAQGDTIKSLEELDSLGRIVWSKNGMPNIKQYLKELSGVELQNIWLGIGADKTDYPTQKPETLLERIIKASSNESDLVADFFCGSGTTAAVAEKLGRKWIVADLGRFAIHTTRKRMIKVQRELKEEDKNFRSFEILNLGKYERRYFLDVNTNLSEEDQKKQMEMKQEQYISLILEGYKAKRVSGFKTLQGKKADRLVYVGPIDFPVTKSVIQDILEECVEKTITKVDVLGFEFEMGLIPYIEQELSEYGVNLILKNIPREVFDKRAVQKGQVKFYDVAYLKVEPHLKGRTVKVELKDFVTKYTQDDLVEIEQSMRKGSDKVVIENGQIIKISKGKDDIITQEILTKNWYDWIDYWAVDYDYESKKEMIKINGNDEKVWTGNYIFENEWQTFRTKKKNELEFISAEYTYPEKGKYKIAVRVVDILGNDTLQVVEVKV